MTFSLKIQGGDLVLNGSQMGYVYGAHKLLQDLTLWMTERYGCDITHPRYGCNFENYIGSAINYTTQSMIQSEALRVLNNYQKVQQIGFTSAPTLYSLSELMSAVGNVNVQISYDTVWVSCAVVTAEQQVVTVSATQST
jgi:phage baseplate assembly protein W